MVAILALAVTSLIPAVLVANGQGLAAPDWAIAACAS
jgi:hypothetical protein